ncbi:MAG: hypothetical protein R3E87_09805 [Burkholderiaceae bacterium]
MNSRLLLMLSATLALAACTPEPTDTLVGCFSTSQGGSQEFRIAQDSKGGYTLAWRRLDHWGEAQPLNLADRAWIEKQFDMDAGKIQASLLSDDGGFAIHRIQSGQSVAGATTESGFLGQFFFGAGQVYKAAECI